MGGPVVFFAVSSEEAIKEGRLPLALFEFREEAEKYRGHALQTGIITEWMVDRKDQTEANLTAVAMRIVTDRLKAPGLLVVCRKAERIICDYVNHEPIDMCVFAELAETIGAAIAKAEAP